MYPYTIAHSPLRMSARCTGVHRGGIVLSVTIRITSKELYTIRFCRIGVWGDPLQTKVCVRVCVSYAQPFYKKKGGLPLKPPSLAAAPAVVPTGDTLGNSCPPCVVGLRTHKPLFFRQPATAAVAALFSVMEVFFHTIPISHRHISLYM